jgi:hypothetical protein
MDWKFDSLNKHGFSSPAVVCPLTALKIPSQLTCCWTQFGLLLVQNNAWCAAVLVY